MRNGRESPSFWWADTNVRLCYAHVIGAAKLRRHWAREASLLMFVGESNQHPESLLATSDRSFKCTSNGRAITGYSEMM
jgi:hypothetical protein